MELLKSSAKETEASNVKTRSQINLKIVRAFEQEGIQFTDRAEYHYQKDSPL